MKFTFIKNYQWKLLIREQKIAMSKKENFSGIILHSYLNIRMHYEQVRVFQVFLRVFSSKKKLSMIYLQLFTFN